MDQWQSYSDPSGSSRRYNGTGQMSPRDYNNGQSQSQSQVPSQAQTQPPAGFKYDQYQGGLIPQQQHSSHSGSPITAPQGRDGNGDVAMQDANDPYASMKYPMRPHHQHHLSSSGRQSNLHSPQEPSAAAQRYSPMEVMSPTSPYAPKTPGSSNQYAQNPAQRQSPSRTSDYPTHSPYFSRQQHQSSQQMQPLSPYVSTQDGYPSSAVAAMDGSFANDPKSPRRFQSQQGPSVRGPVPEFKKVRTLADLRPKVSSQPPFRRANPEGGFISVSPASFRVSSRTGSVSDIRATSLYKHSLSTCPRHIASAIRASNMNRRETLAGC
jgi:dual specificity protein kinase YAK1